MRLRIKPQRVIDKSSGTGGGRESEEEWERSREKFKERRHLRKKTLMPILFYFFIFLPWYCLKWHVNTMVYVHGCCDDFNVVFVTLLL